MKIELNLIVLFLLEMLLSFPSLDGNPLLPLLNIVQSNTAALCCNIISLLKLN